MPQTNKVIALLEELKDLLIQERDVLIENDGQRLIELIQKKETVIIELSKFDDTDVEIERLNVLSREVKMLQETNLTLTQQAMNFTETMLEHIKKAASQHTTYSKKGKYDSSKKSTLLDQSL